MAQHVVDRSALVDYVLDQLEGFGASTRRMFGGTALYRGDAMFGFAYHDRIYFKIDDRNREDYTQAGMEVLIYAPDKTAQRIGSLMEVPADVLEDSDELAEWAAKAVNAARASKPHQSRIG